MTALKTRLRYALWRARREVREVIFVRRGLDLKTARADIAARYLKGDGIEIGALTFPMPMPRDVRVRYVDYFDASGLERTYRRELREGATFVRPDIVDDGARLASFEDESLDFVVASHVLEHVEDPIAALLNQSRVLRSGGVLYLVLPDGRYSFDAARQFTSVEHLLRDHREGPAVSRRGHYEECARLIEGLHDSQAGIRADEMEAENMRPHFHVWEPLSFVSFLAATKVPFSLALLQESHREFIVVLRKQ